MYQNSSLNLDTDKLSYLLKPSPQWCAVNTINNSVSRRDEQKNFSHKEAAFLLFLQKSEKQKKKITFHLAPVFDFHLADQKAVYHNGGRELKVSQEIQLVAPQSWSESDPHAQRQDGCRAVQWLLKGKESIAYSVSYSSWKLCTCKIGLLIKGTGICSVSQCEKEEDKWALWIYTVRLSRGI